MGIALNDEKLTGLILPSFSNIVPEGFFLCDGSAKSRADFENLFSISPRVQSIVTVSTANVITWTTHGLATGHSIQFTTSGVLPIGLTVGVVYFVRVINANTFNLYTTQAQAMNTGATTGQVTFTVTGSGTHTALVYYWGNGNGSTTFNIPDGRGIHLRGIGSPQNFIDTTAYGIVIGQKLDDTVQSHTHVFDVQSNQGGSNVPGGGGGVGGLQSGTGVNSGRTSTETRVKSIGVNYFIKY
jgi:hypothetical protein